jgi:hypothetical protein
MPYTKNFLNYNTKQGVVKHYYGFIYSLGGIVSIKAGDFEKTKGFPNFWAWGYEDNLFQKRVIDNKLTINRNQFYKFMDKNIIQMKDDIVRIVNRDEFDRFVSDTPEGWNTITNLYYEYDDKTDFVNVKEFSTGISENTEKNKEIDLRQGSKPFDIAPKPKRRTGRMGLQMF